MKSICFDKESVAAILEGHKVVTRRLAKEKPCRYRVGETLYVAERWRQSERDARLFVKIVSVREERLHDIELESVPGFRAEGYPPCHAYNHNEASFWWRDRWNSIHKEPGTRFEDNPDVYRIEFKVVEPTVAGGEVTFYPKWICRECGEKYGKVKPGLSTYHDGEDDTDRCGWCGSRVNLTEPRDYGYPTKTFKS